MVQIKTGLWVDHSLPGLQGTILKLLGGKILLSDGVTHEMKAYQYVVTERTANVVSNAVAVTLTLALPRIYILFKGWIPQIIKFYGHLTKTDYLIQLRNATDYSPRRIYSILRGRVSFSAMEPEVMELDRRFSLWDHDPNRRILTGIMETLRNASNSEDAVARLARRHLAMPRQTIGFDGARLSRLRQVTKNLIEDPKAFISILTGMILLFAICIGLQVMAICSNHIIRGTAATLRNGQCAYSLVRWESGWDWLHEATPSDFYTGLTNSAIAYSKACHSANSTATQCQDLLTPTIPYDTTSDDDCPFPAQDLCKLGRKSALTFDTGFLDAKIIGINTASHFEFRRRSTCAPVMDNDTYVHIQDVGPNKVRIEYLYGRNVPGSSRSRPLIHETSFRNLWTEPRGGTYDVLYEPTPFVRFYTYEKTVVVMFRSPNIQQDMIVGYTQVSFLIQQ